MTYPHEDVMRSMGAEPRFKGLSTAREVTVIAGEELGSELGAGGGALLGAGLTSETGPGALVGGLVGGIAFGVAGDKAGGWLAGEMFDSAAEDMARQVNGGELAEEDEPVEFYP